VQIVIYVSLIAVLVQWDWMGAGRCGRKKGVRGRVLGGGVDPASDAGLSSVEAFEGFGRVVVFCHGLGEEMRKRRQGGGI